MPKDMLGRGEAISADEALDRLLALPVHQTPCEDIPIERAYGRVLAASIASPEDLPGFSRSTMDGYAVKAADTFGCSESLPAYLKLVGEINMGENTDISLLGGEAVSIPTGGMLPEDADAVVMFEHVQRGGNDIIEVLKPVAPGENVIAAGEDVKKGEAILDAGHRLRPQDIGVLAGIGKTAVTVYRKPSVAIISTGDEIVPPGTQLAPGQVRDSNSYNLAGLLESTGASPAKLGIFPDDFDTLKQVVTEAIEMHDMVLVSGGSSVGTRDMTAKIIEIIEPGGVIFHGVAAKPGKPLIGGFAKGKPVFGIPGHPAAVTVSFLNFIEPVLLKIGGYDAKGHKSHTIIVKAKLTKNISSAAGIEDHIRVLVYNEEGEWYTEPILGKSGLIHTLVKADGLLVVPQHAQGIAKGEIVDVRLFNL